MPTPQHTLQSLFIDNHSRGKIGDFLREPCTASISEALNRKFNRSRIFDENGNGVMTLKITQNTAEHLLNTGAILWCQGISDGADSRMAADEGFCGLSFWNEEGDLRETDAWVKFLSCEPLIGPLPELNLSRIDWVIVGGESGHKPRPMQPEWVRGIKEQCQLSGTSFFFKQWGGRNKKKAGRTWGEMPGYVFY